VWRKGPNRVKAVSLLRFIGPPPPHTPPPHPPRTPPNRGSPPATAPPQKSQQINIHVSAGFEHAIPANERAQTYVLDRKVTGIGPHNLKSFYITSWRCTISSLQVTIESVFLEITLTYLTSAPLTATPNFTNKYSFSSVPELLKLESANSVRKNRK